MTFNFTPPFTTANMETQLGEMLNSKPLPTIPKERLDKLWTDFSTKYSGQNVPNALTFFTTHMPPLKEDFLYQLMVEATLKKSFDILYSEQDLSLLFKILGSNIAVHLKEKYLNQLLLKPDIQTKLQTGSNDETCVMAWIKLRKASKVIGKIELLYYLLDHTPKPSWMTNTVEEFLKGQNSHLESTLKKDLKAIADELPYGFDLQFRRLIMKHKNMPLTHAMALHLGNMLNDESISFKKRLDLFKLCFDELCSNIKLDKDEKQNYNLVFFSLFQVYFAKLE